MNPGKLSAATVQFQHLPGDKPGNLAIMRRFVEQAAAAGVKLLVFPECCVSGYWHLRKLGRAEMEAIAEEIPEGPTGRTLLKWSREFGMTIGAGLIERGEDGKLYNAYMAAMANGRWANHRKIHAFVSPHLASGDRYTVFDLPEGWRAGVLICYDNNLIENVRMTALKGAQVLLAPHQTGGCRSISPHGMKPIDVEIWERRKENPAAIEAEFASDKGRGWLMRWLPSRAHDNGLFVLFANSVGRDDDEIRTGNAMILDPYGRIVAETGAAADAMVRGELDPELLRDCTGARWIMARRPELYGEMARRSGAEKPIRQVRFGEQEPG